MFAAVEEALQARARNQQRDNLATKLKGMV